MGSLGGVFVLNALFLLAGTSILWSVRGLESWGEVILMGGVSYICGISAVCVLGTLVLIAGGGMSITTILVLALGLTAAGAAVGFKRKRRLPRSNWPRRAVEPGTLISVALAAGAAVLLYEFYRVARLQPLTSWDAWAFWITKAKAIYFFGGLDQRLFSTLPGPSYPLLVPTLAAMNFRFMGSPDTTTLAVQWWLLGVGFVWAAAGLLRRLAPPAVTWLFLLIALLIPELDRRLLERTADWPLDIFFAVAALALLTWIVRGDGWRLWVYGLALAAMLATKREGTLLLACLLLAGLAAAGWRSRRAWLGVAGVAALAYLPNIAWRIWWESRNLHSDAPPGGLLHSTFANGSRVWPSFHLVLRLLFDYQMWLAAAPLALVAALVCLSLTDRRPAIFFLVTFAIGFVGWAWVSWSDPTVVISTRPGLNPTTRTVGSLVLLSIVCAPVLIGQLLERWRERTSTQTFVSVEPQHSAP
jgi:hypothetical protein